jgi:hypothetical protein
MMDDRMEMTNGRSNISKRAQGAPSRAPKLVGPGRRQRGESGSSLILALVYIVAISLIVGALTDWAMNDLGNTTRFQSAASTQAAESGAAEVAIQSIRYYPQYPATKAGTGTPANYANCFAPPAGTGQYGSDVNINNTWVAVWCSTVAVPTSQNTRTVTFVACTESAATIGSAVLMGSAKTNCMSTPNLLAVVVFGDYPSGGGGLNTSVCAGGQNVCGFSATTTQWTWS